MEIPETTFEPLVSSWLEELQAILGPEWGGQASQVRVRVVDGSGIDLRVQQMPGVPEVYCNQGLLRLLARWNEFAVRFGSSAALTGVGNLDASQRLFDLVLTELFPMACPAPVLPSIRKRVTKPGFEAYQTEFLELRHSEFKQRFVSDSSPTGASVRGAAHDSWLALADRLSGGGALLQQLECQVKFLLLHELAHVRLGHLTANAAPIHELEADSAALTIYLARSIRNTDAVSIDHIALLSLFSFLGLVDDLARLVNTSVRVAMPEGLRFAAPSIPEHYPQIRSRGRNVVAAGKDDFNDISTASVVCFDMAVVVLEDYIRHGVLDYSRLKWFARVRSQEALARYYAPHMPGAMSIMRIEHGWDSIDLQWGPLKAELFDLEWGTPILGGRQE